MLRRRFRLCRAKDFEHLRRLGVIYKHPALSLSLATNHLPHNRYGFIIPKRLGKAVQRNRLKRQLREAIRRLHPRLEVGYDLAFIARQMTMGHTTASLQGIMIELCRRAQILREDFGDEVDSAPINPIL